MPLLAKESDGIVRQLIPKGTHPARCSGVWDLGTQYNETFNKRQHKIIIQWEFPKCRIKIDGEDLPMVKSKEYTLSLDERSNLRPMLESWREEAFTAKELKGFNIKNILGVPCKILILHERNEERDKTYDNISTISKLLKSERVDGFSIEPVYYSIEDHGLNVPESTPDWIKEKIKGSEEYVTLSQGRLTHDRSIPTDDYQPPAVDDDIPF